MRFQSIASGSSGNCVYMGSDTTHVLVDVGISRKRTMEALKKLDLDLRDIDGIFITHEHSDHIAGLPMICKKTDTPVYATPGTIRALLRSSKCAEIDPARFIPVQSDCRFTVGDLTVEPMRISHDAAEPVGYRFRYGRKKACVCTDLGLYTDYTVECLKDSDVVLLEANHDIRMLEVGPYPWSLKQRILGARGHLSNTSSGELLSRILNDHMKAVFLGHLSKENNLPELAYETVRMELFFHQDRYRAEELPIRVADRQKASPLIEF